MIIVRLMGGIGNQMFEYAAARRLAHRHNTTLKLDTITLVKDDYRSKGSHHFILSTYGLHNFNIQEDFANSIDVFRVYSVAGLRRMAPRIIGKTLSDLLFGLLIEDGKRHLMQRYYDYDPAAPVLPSLLVGRILSQRFYHFDPEVLEAPDNIYMTGTWMSEKYFKDIEDIIRKAFTFRSPQTGKNKEFAKTILNTESVSVHIRRGDYVTDPKISGMYIIPSLDYYMECAKYIASRVKSPHFFVFSDDARWVKENLRLPFQSTYVDHNTGLASYEDMRLMSQCKHNIIANSSFSWWGAWLNTNPDRIVCAPENMLTLRNFDTKDLIPEEWNKFPSI